MKLGINLKSICFR